MSQKPQNIVGDRQDDTESEFFHNRTLGRYKEEYMEKWSSGYAPVVVRDDKEATREASKRKLKKVKLKHTPGNERYERNEDEPFKT